jgi:integrase
LKGWFEVEGKRGKEREIGVSPETYARLEKEVAEGTRFEFDKAAYRADLKEAAAMTGQEYEGSHGLRWSWAQERHSELQERGMTYEQSLSVVSQEMGHERGDITEHYLR